MSVRPKIGESVIDNETIAKLFDETADLLEITSSDRANPFRVRAYRNGARSVRSLSQQLASSIRDANFNLTDIPGIGKDLAGKILAILETGHFSLLDDLRRQVPASTRDLLNVPNIGPKRARVLQHDLHIHSLDALYAAASEHKLSACKGFGPTSEQKILAGLAHIQLTSGRMLVSEAKALAAAVTKHMKSKAAVPGLGDLVIAGSYRRCKETIGDLDLVVTCSNAKPVMDRLATFDSGSMILGRGETKMAIRLKSGRQIDLRVVPERSLGAALIYFTGSKAHNIVLRKIAADRGLKLNEYGLYKNDEWIAGSTEHQVYRALGLAWIPPELREATGEIELAATNRLPHLIESCDIFGDLHLHTNVTDGRGSLAEMVVAAQRRHYKFIAITDHSRRVTMANGLDETRLRRHWHAIDQMQQKVSDIVLLKGIEIDILEGGKLDLSKGVFAEADWVVGAIHYGQRQSRMQMTKRIVNAMRTGLLNAIAHPTGRLIGQRPPYELDLEEVFRVASDCHCALEINGQPTRLDLGEAALNLAAKYPVRFVVNSDAHAPEELAFMDFAVAQARRGGLEKHRVLNACALTELRSILKYTSSRAQSA
ncbi:MAG: DNA polymerase/3'-5' exonuclease PolX [Proteobacteria bacterium]|nr:DNA polymerase/3'-5' exonuclease PolX [Pseudomonadota bacterium]